MIGCKTRKPKQKQWMSNFTWQLVQSKKDVGKETKNEWRRHHRQTCGDIVKAWIASHLGQKVEVQQVHEASIVGRLKVLVKRLVLFKKVGILHRAIVKSSKTDRKLFVEGQHDAAEVQYSLETPGSSLLQSELSLGYSLATESISTRRPHTA